MIREVEMSRDWFGNLAVDNLPQITNYLPKVAATCGAMYQNLLECTLLHFNNLREWDFAY